MNIKTPFRFFAITAPFTCIAGFICLEKLNIGIGMALFIYSMLASFTWLFVDDYFRE